MDKRFLRAGRDPVRSVLLLIHPQRGKNSDDRYTDQCTDDCERNGDQNACQLRGKQAEVAEDESVPAGGIVDGTLSKQTGGDASPDSADAMAPKASSASSIFSFFLTMATPQ